MMQEQKLLLKIEGHMAIIEKYSGKCADITSFIESESLRSTCILHILLVGELMKGFSSEFRKSHDDVPWADIIGLRDIIAHRYGDIQFERVWEIIQETIPMLAEWLKKIKRNDKD